MIATTTRKSKTTSGASLQADELKRALAAVSAAVPGRTAKPVLSNVLLADGTVTGTDLEMRITAPLAYDGKPLLLPHARLTAIVAQLRDGETVTLTPDGSTCVVASGHATWRLPTEDATEFPAPPVSIPGSRPVGRLPCDQFRTLVASVRFATDNESSRYALGAVCVEYTPADDNGELVFVGTDGRRMAVASCEITESLDKSQTLVPRRVMDVLYRLASGDDAIQLERTDQQIIGTIRRSPRRRPSAGDTVVVARQIEGRYPRWRDVDPKRTIASSQVVVGSLLHACRQAAICTSEDSLGVTFAFTKEGLHLTSRSAQAGEASVTCDLVTAGNACVVKLDPRFVVEWLGCGSFDLAETIEVEAEGDTTAVVLRAQDSRCVIMPLAKE